MRKKLIPVNRAAMLSKLSQDKVYDVVVIGAGATGLGIAVDAASRGLSVLVVDAQDFSQGTSSRSTKLIHGGVRYMKNPKDWKLVHEALFERRTLIRNAPEIVHPKAFILPCYRAYEVPYYTLGLALYSLMAMGGGSVGNMSVHGGIGTLCQLPGLRAKGLKGGVKFYDAQFDDSRMAIALMQTAVAWGAVALNYMRVTGFHSTNDAIDSAQLTDQETGKQYWVRGKMFFNCAGCWVDNIRGLVDPGCSNLMRFSRGTHLIVDRSFLPTDTGMFIPKTSDGRVLFCIPWHGDLEIGTTDIEQGQAPFDIQPTEDEIDFILTNANAYLARPIKREDVKAAFCGIRPLLNPQAVGEKNRGGSAKLSREHVVIPEYGNMITVAGGKWTSYRRMAEHAMQVAMEHKLIPLSGCHTRNLPLICDMTMKPETLEQEADRSEDLEAVKAKVLAYARYCVRTSQAFTGEDVLYRRLRLGFLNTARTQALLPEVNAAVKDELAKSAA